MSVFSLLGSLATRLIGGGTRALRTVAAPAVIGTGVGVAGALVGEGLVGGRTRRRRRSRKRITDRELQELIMLKAVVGTRSPLLTIAGIKMLNRGG